jgi:hypothetical protein
MFKTNALSDKDIIHILKSQGIKFNGIFMKDELPSKLKQGFYIINLQSSNIGDGTHWTVLYYSYKHSLYFDAFGFVPPVEVEQKLNRYAYNNKQIQNLESTACGYYCIAFIIFMYKRKKIELELGFKLFVDAFSTDTKNNDKLLYKYLYN